LLRGEPIPICINCFVPFSVECLFVASPGEHLLRGEPIPICINCFIPLSVECLVVASPGEYWLRCAPTPVVTVLFVTLLHILVECVVTATPAILFSCVGTPVCNTFVVPHTVLHILVECLMLWRYLS
jgi:hypothetical protein